MKYIKLFENYRSYFEILTQENRILVSNKNIFCFNKMDIKILSDFLNDRNMKYEFVGASITSSHNSFSIEDSYDLDLGVPFEIEPMIRTEITVMDSDEKSSIFKANQDIHDSVKICEINNYSLIIVISLIGGYLLSEGFNQNIYINKCMDEWFVGGYGRSFIQM